VLKVFFSVYFIRSAYQKQHQVIPLKCLWVSRIPCCCTDCTYLPLRHTSCIMSILGEVKGNPQTLSARYTV